MKYKLFVSWILILVLLRGMVRKSYIIALFHSHRDKVNCNDQVGDSYIYFQKEKKCKDRQIHDEVAESLCYYED